MFSLAYKLLQLGEWLRRTFKYPLLIHNVAYQRLLWLLIALILANAVYAASSSRGLSDLIVVHRNIYFGIDRIGPWHYLLLSPLVGVAVGIVHYVAAGMLYDRDKVLSFYVLASAVALEALLVAGSAFIVAANA